MSYVCTREWRDLSDRHLYREGDPYPFDGREISAERLEQLESGRNRAGLQMIRSVAEKKPAETPKPAEEPRKAPVRRKKAAAK